MNSKITFAAEKLSEERTGIHARITILRDDNPLAWSYFNVERREDRSALAGAAHKGIKGDLEKAYPADDLRRDLDNFCAGLWDFHISHCAPEELEGDETLKPLVFLLKPYILDGGGTILFAPPGRGKSHTGLVWAVSIDAGITTYWPVTQSKVLYINLERSKDSIKRRLGAMNRILGLSPTRPLLMINAKGKSLSQVIAPCRKAVAKYGIKFAVLDSISRAGYGDLTQNEPMNQIIDTLNGLCFSWLALAHSPRKDEEHAYGSVMQDAGADICVRLSSQIAEDNTLGLGWEIVKQNDTPKTPMEIMAFEFGEFGLTGIRKALRGEFPEVEGKRTISMVDAIKEFILNQDSGDATGTEIAEGIGFSRARIASILSTSGEFVKTRREKHSQYYGVLEKGSVP